MEPRIKTADPRIPAMGSEHFDTKPELHEVEKGTNIHKCGNHAGYAGDGGKWGSHAGDSDSSKFVGKTVSTVRIGR